MTTTPSALRCVQFAWSFIVTVLLQPAALSGQSICATPYTITTLAGTPGGSGALDGQGNDARFNFPASTAVDFEGNVYVADYNSHTIRKITADGLVTTFAGSPGSRGSVDGTGSAARFSFPSGVAVDRTGNVYVADSGNGRIRRITPSGNVTTLAGSTQGSANGPGLTAQFFNPRGVGVDSNGNVFVADTSNSTIRKITPEGMVTTFAGLANSSGAADGAGSAARFYAPYGLAVDGADNIYVADTGNFTVRKITPDGLVTTLAGTLLTAGTADGTGASARFGTAYGVAADYSGNVYVADTNNQRIRKITSAGVVTTAAGNSGLTISSGWNDGTGGAAQFNYPNGLSVDAAGNLYVADQFNHEIRKITATGVVTTFAGSALRRGSSDGLGADATFREPRAITVDEAGAVYVGDYFSGRIRKISATGVVTTFVGSTDSYQPISHPSGMAVDTAGNLYVSDYNMIKKITPSGSITAFAGLTSEYGQVSDGSSDGTGTLAHFNGPRGVAIDGAGNLYVADTGNSTIRKITPAGVVTTIAGQAGVTGSLDGPATVATFKHPAGVAVNHDGDIFVTDSGNNTIRQVSAGIVTTLAGTPHSFPTRRDGTGPDAGFYLPRMVAIDAAGDLYITEMSAIRKVTRAGVVTTLAGSASFETGALDGTGFAARFDNPEGVAIDGAGNLYIADSYNSIIRKGVPPADREETVRAGYPKTLGPKPSGLSAPSYRWQKNGVDIPGANNASLAITHANFNDSGVYRLIAANSFGLSVSAEIKVTVLPAISASGHAADFNGDGRADLIWSNSVTGEVAVWQMNGVGFLNSVPLGDFLLEWTAAGTGDFNTDGKTDILWSDSITGERALWLMNGTNLLGISTLGVFPLEWTVAATGDFNADGKPDIVWSNSSTGERALWLMNGTNLLGVSTLGIFPLEWTVAATGDFNFDGKPDLVWSNSITGERALWLMDGTNFLAASTLGVFPLEWTVAGTADFNGDGKPDIIWSNSVTGERALWLMNGTQFLGASTLGIFPLEWTVKN